MIREAACDGRRNGPPCSAATSQTDITGRDRVRTALNRRPRIALLGFAFALSVLASSAAIAQSLGAQAPQFTGVELGFRTVFKVGYWTPVELTLRGGRETVEGHVRVIVPDVDGVPTVVQSERPLILPAGQSRTVQLYVKPGRADGWLRAVLMVGDEVAAQRRWEPGLEATEREFPFPAEATDELVVTVGQGGGLKPSLDSTGGSDRHLVNLSDASELPTRWYGYSAVDALILTTGDPGRYRSLSGNQRAAALQEWIELGGHAVLSVGANAAEILTEDAPLAGLLPARFARMESLRSGTALEEYAGKSERIDPGGKAFPLPVPELVDVQGRIEVAAGQGADRLPLVIKAARGLGRVSVITVDIDQPPLRTWAGREALTERLLDIADREQAEQDEATGSLTTIGYDDISGDLRAALFDFRDVSFVAFWVVALLVVVYILIIGPFDFWLVKRVFRRMEATWITFPLWVLAISAGAYFLAHHLKGRDLRVNQVELVDVDLTTGRTRGTLWTNIFSPNAHAYDFSLAPELPGALSGTDQPDVLLSWLGLPGSGLGGMSNSGSVANFDSQAYAYGPRLERLVGVPVQVWSTKSLTARWHTRTQLPLQADLQADINARLQGKLINRTGLDLSGARLFYDRWVYQIASLEDGEVLRLTADSRPVLSRTLLSKQQILGEATVSTNFRPGTGDVPRIMEIMLFYKLSGGAGYTGSLVNEYLEYCDLSEHLRLGRAILYVPTDHEGSHLLDGDIPLQSDKDRRWTFYRFILPVETETKGTGGN